MTVLLLVAFVLAASAVVEASGTWYKCVKGGGSDGEGGESQAET
jgi:hypothetical protein